MRTTLTIDDDLLAAARGIAARDEKTLGEVISLLARKSLQMPQADGGMRNGMPLLAVRKDAVPVTDELVNRLLDETP